MATIHVPPFLAGAINSYINDVVAKIASTFELNESEVRACFNDAKGVDKRIELNIPKTDLWLIEDYDKGMLMVGGTFQVKDKLLKVGQYRAVTEYGPAYLIKDGVTKKELEKTVGKKFEVKTVAELSGPKDTPKASKETPKDKPKVKEEAKENGVSTKEGSKKESSKARLTDDEDEKSKARIDVRAKAKTGKSSTSSSKSSSSSSSDDGSDDEVVPISFEKNKWENLVIPKTDIVVIVTGKESFLAVGTQNPKASAAKTGLKSVFPLDEKSKSKCAKSKWPILSKSTISQVKDKTLVPQLKELIAE